MMADVSPPQTSEPTSKQSESLTVGDAKGNSVAKDTATKNEGSKDTKPVSNQKDSETNAVDSTEAPSEVKIKEKEDSGVSATDVAETAPTTANESAVNGSADPTTPSTAKKTNGSSSAKKKSTGVPEHKSKKLNKKKSKAEFHLDCQPGDLFLARMKGHAPWPSIVCDEEILPESLLNSRPVTTALPDGTFKRPDYAPGGKRQGERTYPVMFLYTNEFAWLPNTDLTPITPEECKDVEEKGKSKSLIAAYGVAAEGHDLQHFKTMLADHQAALQEDIDLQNEKEAEKAAAKAAKAESKKARRKSAPATQDGEDEMDVDGEPSAEKPKSKKRKKAAETEEETEEKPAKTPKLKLNGPKTPSTDKKSTAKPKSSSKKAAAPKDSDEEMEDASAVEATPMSAAEIREKKDKEIRYYRHKLQRGLLSRSDVPSDEEVANASSYLQKLETYPALEGEIIRSTKIHKVLRAMIRLPVIPKDEVYQMKKRCSELLQKWHHILGNDSTVEASTEGAADIENKDGESAAQASTSAAPETAKSEEKQSSTEASTKVNGTTDTPIDGTKTEGSKADSSAPKKTAEAKKPDQSEAVKTGEEPEKSTEIPAGSA